MSQLFDTIVVGLGAMGSAAVCHLAARGRRVLGLDRYRPPHRLGSTHGRSRNIRQAYLEGALYVPLVQRAFALWEQLHFDSGATLLTLTGGLTIGLETSSAVIGSLASARRFDLTHRLLTAAEIRRRFPALQPPDDFVGLWEQQAGFIAPEAAVRAHLALADRNGAILKTDTAVESWRATPHGGVSVTTRDDTFRADTLVLAAGPWTGGIAAEPRLPLSPRQVAVFRFDPGPRRHTFSPMHCPIHFWQLPDGTEFYGLPDDGSPSGGIKVAFHNRHRACDPDRVERSVPAKETTAMQDCLRRFIPSLGDRCLATGTCLYTLTPDHHFIVGPHPCHPQVFVAAGFSGHGFKFSPVIGEILADLVIDGRSRHRIDGFDPLRFSAPRQTTACPQRRPP